MRGRRPKDPALLQRRNKVTSRATLHVQEERWKRAPSLPKRADGDWHPLTKTWWTEVWHSPMAQEYLKADVQGLYRVAMLVDRFWRFPSVHLEARICLSQALYGLTPMDRRRLQWIVERAEEGKKHRTVSNAVDPTNDPRRLLQIVS